MADFDVIVVGCGASGVAALRRLHDAGLKVVALEAADRIGGRILTVPFGDGVVDMGAAWCCGAKNNVVFDLCNPLGLLDFPKPFNDWFLLSNGELLPYDSGVEILKALSEELAKADKNNTKSVRECFRDAANSNNILNKNPKLTSSVIEWFERNCHIGGQDEPQNAKSLRGLMEYMIASVGSNGSELMLNWKERGFKSILDVLLNKYPDPSKEIRLQMELNKEVESIKWHTIKSNVQIDCKDGSSYTAKSVIVTVSVGVLKDRHEKLFDPPLPEEKVNTINNLQLCVLGKIYVEFEAPWWPKTPAYFTILWQEEDKAKLAENEKWVSGIYGLQTVEQPNVLLVWTGGLEAKAMEKVSEEAVRTGIEKVLDSVRKQFSVTPIKNIIRSQWAMNPLARCAYAYRCVTTEEKGGSAVILSEPLLNVDGFPVLCFAGEATSHHRHTAVDGAVEAGFREADRLIDCFKI